MKKPLIFPAPDTEFNDYLGTAIPYLNTNSARLTVSAGNIALITGQKPVWDKNWTDYVDPTKCTATNIANKILLRGDIETAMRSIFNDIPESVLTTDDREALRLKARDAVKTRIGVMDHAPVVTAVVSDHLQHTLTFKDKDQPDSKALPDGQKIVLERFVGAAGLSNGALAFANGRNITRTKAKVSFDELQAGETCYYRSCYENTHGERSGWSAIVSAIIP